MKPNVISPLLVETKFLSPVETFLFPLSFSTDSTKGKIKPVNNKTRMNLVTILLTDGRPSEKARDIALDFDPCYQ